MNHIKQPIIKIRPLKEYEFDTHTEEPVNEITGMIINLHRLVRLVEGKVDPALYNGVKRHLQSDYLKDTMYADSRETIALKLVPKMEQDLEALGLSDHIEVRLKKDNRVLKPIVEEPKSPTSLTARVEQLESVVTQQNEAMTNLLGLVKELEVYITGHNHAQG